MNELPCPEMTAAFDVAERILDRFGHLHNEPEAVRGLIMVQRAVTEELHAILPCRPSTGQNGQLVCSLASVINAVSGLVMTPSLQSGNAMQLDGMAKGQTAERETGMFL